MVRLLSHSLALAAALTALGSLSVASDDESRPARREPPKPPRATPPLAGAAEDLLPKRSKRRSRRLRARAALSRSQADEGR